MDRATNPRTPLNLRRWQLIVLAALVFAAYAFIEQRYIAERRELVLQQDDIAQALALAYLEDHGPIFQHEGALYAGRYRINWSDSLVNAVNTDSGCGITIFQGDEIIATTMVKPGTNERAVGLRAPAGGEAPRPRRRASLPGPARLPRRPMAHRRQAAQGRRRQRGRDARHLPRGRRRSAPSSSTSAPSSAA